MIIIQIQHDTTNSNRNYLKNYEREWLLFYKNFNLKDMLNNYKTKDKFDKKYLTWSNNSTATRIDRVYFKSNNNINIQHMDTKLFPNSDHRIVIAKIDINNEKVNIKNQSNRWILNDKILEDEYVSMLITKLCNNYIKNSREPEAYDTFIDNLQELLKRESKFLHDEKIIMMNHLQKQYNILLDKTDEDSIVLKVDIKKEIEAYYSEQLEGLKKR